MIKPLSWLALLLAAGAIPAVLVLRADNSNAAPTPKTVEVALTNRLAPGLGDPEIAYVTARLLEQNHFAQHPFDDDYSEKFFERYLETLDPQKLHFTRADLDEFAGYRTNLDNLTFVRRRAADTTPAYLVFNRFRERLEQRANYAQELLKNETFVFDTDERVLLNRRDAEPPADLVEARKLWRQRLRSEYLQEKLAKHAARKKAEHAPSAVETNSPTMTANEPAKGGPKKTEAEEIVDTLNRRYTRNSHFFREMDNEDVLEYYLTSLAHVYDPHSDYFNPRQADNFAISMNLALFGIGAVLSTDMDGYCKIMDLKPGPATNSKKIKVGDRIVAVAQSNAPPVDVVEMNLNKVVQMIRGPKGSEVRLTIVSSDSTADRRDVMLIRDEIKLDDQAAKAKIIDLPAAGGKTVRIGVIDLPSFYVPMELGGPRKPDIDTPHYTSTDVARLLTKLKAENCQGIVLDLRRNGGGSLEECVKLTGLFIKSGPVVQVSDGRSMPVVDNDPDDTVLYDGPLVVLTSRLSASASEILAGALQDYERAIVVGDLSTHGKGTVQQLNPLRHWIEPRGFLTNDPGTLKITKAKFYRASGASTQLKGVMSDIVLPSRFNYMKDIGESALENALAWDTIPSARYDKLDLVTPYLPELLNRSSDRVATNQDFAYIREDIEQFRKVQAENSVSLNERERIKEWEEEDARQRARDKERLARKSPEPTIYEITLKQADLPGLPPPVGKTNTLSEFKVNEAGDGRASARFVFDKNFLTNFTSEQAASIKAELETNPAIKLGDFASGGRAVKDASLSMEEDAEDAPPAVDATLDESQRILVDYIGLLARKGIASTARPTTATTTP